MWQVMKSKRCHWRCWPSASRKASALQLDICVLPKHPAALREDNACPSPIHFLLLIPLRRKYLSCPWSLKDNGGCSHHALCNFPPFMPRLSSYFSNDKSFSLVSLSLFQAHSCANNWLISCGSLEMSRCEVAFGVRRFGKAPLYLYALGHEVRLVLTQLALFRRAFGVSILLAYEPRSTSSPSCFVPKRPSRYTATAGSGLEITHHPLPAAQLWLVKGHHGMPREDCTWATSW